MILVFPCGTWDKRFKFGTVPDVSGQLAAMAIVHKLFYYF